MVCYTRGLAFADSFFFPGIALFYAGLIMYNSYIPKFELALSGLCVFKPYLCFIRISIENLWCGF